MKRYFWIVFVLFMLAGCKSGPHGAAVAGTSSFVYSLYDVTTAGPGASIMEDGDLSTECQFPNPCPFEFTYDVQPSGGFEGDDYAAFDMSRIWIFSSFNGFIGQTLRWFDSDEDGDWDVVCVAENPSPGFPDETGYCIKDENDDNIPPSFPSLGPGDSYLIEPVLTGTSGCGAYQTVDGGGNAIACIDVTLMDWINIEFVIDTDTSIDIDDDSNFFPPDDDGVLIQKPVEICNNIIDDDGDLLADCDDPDCTFDPACVESSCDDGKDNNGNGLIDCQDISCNGQLGPGGMICESPEQTCNDGMDNDQDSFIDCLDDECNGQPGGPSGEMCEFGMETLCSDLFDNDGDGLTDGDDSDCSVAAEICNNGMDDDGDLLDDCLDPDCDFDPFCTEICDNTFDDDGDGKIDCAEPMCDGLLGPGGITCESPNERTCDNDIDDDTDGFSDCQDPDCAGQWKGPMMCEINEATCNDGSDNDEDGSADCLDNDCNGINNCEFSAELTCNDGFDNDGDGLGDCLDNDCNGIDNCEFGIETTCSDSFDNDADGFPDCLDDNCDGLVGGPGGEACQFDLELTCDDGFDNDGDGLTDTLDDDCAVIEITVLTTSLDFGTLGTGGLASCSIDTESPPGTCTQNPAMSAGGIQIQNTGTVIANAEVRAGKDAEEFIGDASGEYKWKCTGSGTSAITSYQEITPDIFTSCILNMPVSGTSAVQLRLVIPQFAPAGSKSDIITVQATQP